MNTQKYGIIEINHRESFKNIISFVDSIGKFKEFVMSNYQNAQLTNTDDVNTNDVNTEDFVGNTYPEAMFMDNIGIDKLETDQSFKDGFYLLTSQNGTVINLVEKFTDVLEGYFFNSHISKTKMVRTWELVKCNLPKESLFDIDTTAKDVNNDTLKLKKFNINSIIEHPHMLFIGKRGSGKTTSANTFLANKDRDFIKNSLIISPKEKVINFYTERYPEATIIYSFDSVEIKKCLENSNPGAVVLDDCLGSIGTWVKDKALMELLFNGRHYKKTIMVIVQYSLGIKPELRCNFDYIFMSEEHFHSNMKRLYDHYAGMFSTFREFKDVFIDYTGNHRALVISNRCVKSKNLLDKVFWFKAEKNANIEEPVFYHLL